MRIQPPKVDDRNAPEIVADVRRLLAQRLPTVQLDREQGPVIALVNVFARFGEIIVDRINRAPDKNFLAFLDLLGISPVPQTAARVPVTFYLAAGRVDAAVVPKLTQVAAELGKGEQKPIVFETERELVVVSTRLESLFAKYGVCDQYVDYHSALPQIEVAQASESKVFAPPRPGPQLIPHALYVGLPIPSTLPSLDELRLSFVLEELGQGQGSLDARTVRWESNCTSPDSSPDTSPDTPAKPGGLPASGKDARPLANTILAPTQDTTANLSKSGDVVFANLEQWPPGTIEGVSSHWMCCRLQTAISYKSEPSPRTVRETHLPRVKSLSVSMRRQRDALVPQYAFANSAKLDLTKDFYPFGEKPKFGDTFYLACDEAFSLPDAIVTLKITLTNPASGGVEPAIPRVNPRGTKLGWEFWDGETWAELGTSDLSQPSQPETGRRIRILGESEQVKPTTDFADTTRAFSDSDKEVSFRFSRAPKKLAVNGQQGFWIRVRIIAGDYGKDAYLERDAAAKGPVLIPSSLSPPSISKITVGYRIQKESPAETLLTYNDWQFSRIDPTHPFSCFLPLPKEDRPPTVYFGFSPPLTAGLTAPLRKAAFSGRSMSIYIGLRPPGPGQRPPAVSSQTSVEWEYWNGSMWMKWTVRDETLGLRRSGLIRFLAPFDYAARQEFGQERYWLRFLQNDAEFRANLGVVVLNTTMATHCLTSIDEVIGTSNGQASQKFQTARTPVLEGQRLEVREQSVPSAKERAQIMSEEGDDAIQKIPAPAGKGDEIWIRWHEVTNFYHSRPRDRHYVLNSVTGEVTFGDGTCGMVPPALAGNIRMASYRTGGGAVGNKPALTVKQLKSAVPYIKGAMNWEAADKGADAESIAALLERGPTQIRHGGRAITVQDFEDLAKRVSPEVARAMCVPLHDLVTDSAMSRRKPGVLSLIVVPQSSEPRPFPSSDLLLSVQSALRNSCPPATSVIVLGPEYAAADVHVKVAVVDPDTASDVELRATLAIKSYLHPLTGGLDQGGWEFGRMPQRSELFKLVEDVPGVHHVIDLTLTIAGTVNATSKLDQLLICAGRVRVAAVLADDTN